jgi:hypothetical protein
LRRELLPPRCSVADAIRITDSNRKWLILVTMTGALSMILIDETVVSVALQPTRRLP